MKTYIFKNKILLILTTLFLFSGCGYKEITTQVNEKAYLKFSKTYSKSYTVTINDKYKFNLEACIENKASNTCKDYTKDSLYEIKSGKTFIKVKDSKNNIILTKEIYIGSNNTVEIDLP